MSVKEAAHYLGIARSTLYGHIRDLEYHLGEAAGTHRRFGGRIIITAEDFIELQRRLKWKAGLGSHSGMEKVGKFPVLSPAKEYEKALELAQKLKDLSREELRKT